MVSGFYTLMSALFFSSLADNALYVAALALLQSGHTDGWQKAALIAMFALFYVVLAPFVGAYADSLPKGRVMLVSNGIKIIGCLMMLFGVHPLLAYAVVGFGAATYSPAKYGIVTELVPANLLVKANGWIEGLTITSIILGVAIGGLMIKPAFANHLLALGFPALDSGEQGIAKIAIALLISLYLLAALFNLGIPRSSAALVALPKNIFELVPTFWQNNLTLWRDRLGQISLATTTLFWGVSGNLRYIVLAWAAAALTMQLDNASLLVGVVAVGTAVGAVVASIMVRIDQAPALMPLGIGMGLLLLVLILIHNLGLAIPFLVLLGGLGGFLVVPMNAMLQHRGHKLMGAGRSIAVQNFNEQACILGLNGILTFATSAGLNAYGAITIFGLATAGLMWLIQSWHRHNCRVHKAEVDRLLEIARTDKSSAH